MSQEVPHVWSNIMRLITVGLIVEMIAYRDDEEVEMHLLALIKSNSVIERSAYAQIAQVLTPGGELDLLLCNLIPQSLDKDLGAWETVAYCARVDSSTKKLAHEMISILKGIKAAA